MPHSTQLPAWDSNDEAIAITPGAIVTGVVRGCLLGLLLWLILIAVLVLA